MKLCWPQVLFAMFAKNFVTMNFVSRKLPNRALRLLAAAMSVLLYASFRNLIDYGDYSQFYHFLIIKLYREGSRAKPGLNSVCLVI